MHGVHWATLIRELGHPDFYKGVARGMKEPWWQIEGLCHLDQINDEWVGPGHGMRRPFE